MLKDYQNKMMDTSYLSDKHEGGNRCSVCSAPFDKNNPSWVLINNKWKHKCFLDRKEVVR